MKKNIVKLVIFIVLMIAISNVFSGLINLIAFGVGKGYTYETFDGKYKFTFIPSKGSRFERIENKFGLLQQNEPQYIDTKLRRTFKCEPYHFWNWYSYLFSEEYDFQYSELSNDSIHYRGFKKQ